MKVHCENLNHSFDIPDRPARVVSLASGVTEALVAMGCGHQIAGVSAYCSRYVPDLAAPVVGEYLKVDEEQLAQVDPDLVLVTTGVQRKLGLELAGRGLPVYALPLPGSFHGILENIVTVSALMNNLRGGRALTERLMLQAAELMGESPEKRPRVYVELWFGRHMRTIGGQTFIHDLVTMAGGDPTFADCRAGYFVPDFHQVAARRPEILLFFFEPEYPVDVNALLVERGWARELAVPWIESTVDRGRNLIHDGPSIMETAAWLRGQI